MTLTCFGAAGEVTGSKHVLEIAGKHILLDCGMFQGAREHHSYQNGTLPFDARTIDAVVLSHGHLDHCGSLPTLIKNGFAGKIYATAATRDVAELIMKDSAKIQTQDAEYHNKHLMNGELPMQPLYTDDDVIAVIPHFETLEYGACRAIIPGVELCFSNSGHILGSSLIHLTIDEAGKRIRLAFTGDLGSKNMPILDGPTPLAASDIVIAESTYGGKLHGSIPESAEKLASIIQEAVEKKSKIFVPAFALGRMQTLIYTLHKLTDAGKLPRIPVYVDSPLAVEMTDVFMRHPECFDEETRRIFTLKGEVPFDFHNLHYVSSVEDSKSLNNAPGPMMILATSGMMEAGRILHHLMNGLDNPNNVVLIVGYMAEHTLGRAVLEGAPTVRIFHREIPVRAKVVKLNAYSAHADQAELANFVALTPELKHVFLVHGDETARQSLAAAIREKQPHCDVLLPMPGVSYQLSA